MMSRDLKSICAFKSRIRSTFDSTLLLMLFVFITIMLSQSISASNIIKDNNDTELNTSSSWVGGVTPGVADIAVWNYTVTGPNIVSTGSDISYLGIQIIDPAGEITISDNTLTLGLSGVDLSSATQNLNLNPAVSISTDQEWSTAVNRQIWCGGVVSGNGNLTKSGDGYLFLAGNNSFTGTVTALEGFLYPYHANALGSISSGTTINNGATLMMDGTDGDISLIAEPITINGAGVPGWGAIGNYVGSNTISGTITMNSASTINVGKDKLTISGVVRGPYDLRKDGTDTLMLSGANTYSGITNVDTGIVLVASGDALGTIGSGTVVTSGAQLQVLDGVSDFYEPLTLNGNGIDNTGALISAVDATSAIRGDITIATASSIGCPSITELIRVYGDLYGSGDLTTVGSGQVCLYGNSPSYTGTITISASFTPIGPGPNALGASSAGTIVSNGSTLSLGGGTYAEPITLNGLGYTTYGTLYCRISSTLTGDIVLASNTRINSVDADDRTTIEGSISGNYSIDKIGKGVLVLSGDNTHSGTVSVSEGKLLINGTNTSQVSISVDSGTVLGGTGSTAAAVTMEDGSVLKPGDESATSFTSGTVTMTESCSLNVDIGTSSDTVVVDGDIFLDGIINISNGAGFGPGIYTIMTCTGSITDSGLIVGRDPGTYNYLIATDANNVFLHVTSAGVGSSIVKANNTIDLNIGSSWIGGIAPGAIDTAVWDNTVTSLDSVILGANSSWAQVKILNPSADIFINDDTLTLGIGGVDMSNATQNLIFVGTTVELGANQSFNIAVNRKLRFNGPLIGSYSVEKMGLGTLIFQDDSINYSGETVITEGTIQVGATGGRGALPGDVTNNGELVFRKDADYTYYGVISGTGMVTQDGTETITLAGNNSYSGVTKVSTGAISANHDNALGDTISGTVVSSGSTLMLEDTIKISEPITLNGMGVLNGGALVNVSGENHCNGTISLSSSSSISNESSDFLYLNGVISGSGDLTKIGNGPVVLRGENSYTGITTVADNILWLMKDNSLGSNLGATVISSGASAYLINNVNISESFSILGTGDEEKGVIRSYRDTNTISGKISLNGVSAIGVKEDRLIISGIVEGDYELVKVDTGSLVLSGINTHSSSVSVSAGSLYLNGSNNSQTSISIDSSAKLCGTGSTMAHVSMKDGSFLEPGDFSVSTLIVGALTMTNGSALNVDVGGLTNDTVAVLGDLVLDGRLNVYDSTDYGPGTYTIITYNGTLTNNDIIIGSTPTTYYDYSIEVDSNSVKLIISIGNDAPIAINPIPDIIVQEDAADTIIAILTNVFKDEDTGSDLTYGTYSLGQSIVSGLIINDTTISLSFVENAHGTTNVVISATDSENAIGYDTVQVTVNSVNDVPVLHSITPWVMEEGLPVTLTLSQVHATDVENDDLSIVIDSGANYTVDSLTIYPTIGFLGDLTIPLSVTDGIDTSNQLTVTVEVKYVGVNRPPILTSANITPIEKNGSLRVTTDMLNAFDPDGDSLTIFIWEGDFYATQGTRIIPEKGFSGILEVPIQVTDGIGLSNQLLVEVSVFEKVIDFYKGQIINSDTYEASVGPNPLPPEVEEIHFRSKLLNSDILKITIFNELGNVVHRGETDAFNNRFYYTWNVGSGRGSRGRAYLILLEYYKNGYVVKRDKKMIGVKR